MMPYESTINPWQIDYPMLAPKSYICWPSNSCCSSSRKSASLETFKFCCEILHACISSLGWSQSKQYEDTDDSSCRSTPALQVAAQSGSPFETVYFQNLCIIEIIWRTTLLSGKCVKSGRIDVHPEVQIQAERSRTKQANHMTLLWRRSCIMNVIHDITNLILRYGKDELRSENSDFSCTITNSDMNQIGDSQLRTLLAKIYLHRTLLRGIPTSTRSLLRNLPMRFSLRLW